jgi:hypothetical protein
MKAMSIDGNKALEAKMKRVKLENGDVQSTS